MYVNLETDADAFSGTYNKTSVETSKLNLSNKLHIRLIFSSNRW